MTEITEPFRPTIRSQADLERAWTHVLPGRSFTRHSVWLMLIEADDRPQTRLLEIDQWHEQPTRADLETFAELAGALLHDLAPGGRWAFLLTRPGGAGVTDLDRRWASGLLGACRGADVPTDVVHLATDVGVVALPFDELASVA